METWKDSVFLRVNLRVKLQITDMNVTMSGSLKVLLAGKIYVL